MTNTCALCNEPTSEISANPGRWSVVFYKKAYHWECLSNALRERDRALAALRKFENVFKNWDILAKGLPAQLMLGDAIEAAKAALGQQAEGAGE